MRWIVGAMVAVIVALAAPGAAQAGLLRDTLLTVQATMAETATECSSYAGYRECTSEYGPVTSTCNEASWLNGASSSCAVLVGTAGATCQSYGYASSRGGGESAGCYVVADDVKVGCADVSSYPPSYPGGPTSQEDRAFMCTAAPIAGPVGVPLDPALP